MSTDNLDLRPTPQGDRIAIVQDGQVSYAPARRIGLAAEVSSGGLCRYIKRSSNGDLYVLGPGIDQRALHSTDGGVQWTRRRTSSICPGLPFRRTYPNETVLVRCLLHASPTHDS